MTAFDTNTLIKAALSAVLASAKIAESSNGSGAINNKGNLRDIVTQTDIDIS